MAGLSEAYMSGFYFWSILSNFLQLLNKKLATAH